MQVESNLKFIDSIKKEFDEILSSYLFMYIYLNLEIVELKYKILEFILLKTNNIRFLIQQLITYINYATK